MVKTWPKKEREDCTLKRSSNLDFSWNGRASSPLFAIIFFWKEKKSANFKASNGDGSKRKQKKTVCILKRTWT